MTYAANQSTAVRMIADKGQDVALTRRSAGAYDVATSTATISETTTVTSGVVLPLTRWTFGLMKQAGSNVLSGDKQLLLAGDIDPPHVDDIATIGGDAYTIIEVSPLNPGGTELLYDCIIRGAA